MKIHHLTLLIALAGNFVGTLRGQVEPAPPNPAGSVEITGELPDGTPPPPSPEIPRLRVGPEDILSSRTADDGKRKITFEKVTPFVLPSPPPVAPAELTPELSAELAQLREERLERMTVFMGATAYVSKTNPDDALSFVRLLPSPTRQGVPPNVEPVHLWINANLLWLTGFGEFKTDTATYSLMMMISPGDLDFRRSHEGRLLDEAQGEELPNFTDTSKASYIVVSGNPTAEELAPINALVDLYNSDKERLKSAYLGRVALSEEMARERAINPPEKKNLVLKYWRLDAAGQKGQTSKPADIR